MLPLMSLHIMLIIATQFTSNCPHDVIPTFQYAAAPGRRVADGLSRREKQGGTSAGVLTSFRDNSAQIRMLHCKRRAGGAGGAARGGARGGGGGGGRRRRGGGGGDA